MQKKKKQQQEQSEDIDDDSQNQKTKIDFNRPKINRVLKENNLKKIIINVSMTQYPVVTQVAQQLNWKVQTDTQAGDWDIFWTDFSIDPDILIRMHLHQKINHFPGIYIIARKNLLGLNLMNMRNKFPQQYNFFPLTWMLPSQYSEFRMYFQSIPKGKVRTYIVKPEAQCQGRGIFLTRNIQDLQNGSHYVVQRYLNRPYLIDKLKFDFRIYVLLAGSDPLRVYLYDEGLVRFATEPYVQPNSTNLDQNFIHLTNYAINKLNPKFVFNKGVNDMSTGHKRSLTSVYKLLQKKGQDIPKLKSKINDIIIKTLITSNPSIGHQYRYSQPQEYYGNMCFHILGFDILLTQTCQPLLLQVNHTPSFTTDTPLDAYIKHNLIKDTLILMNITPKTKSILFNKAKLLNSQRLLTGKRQIYQGQIKRKQVQKAQLQRDQYQNEHLGRFQKIHPVKEVDLQNKYNQLLEFATKAFLEQNTERAKMERLEAKKMMKQQRQMFKQKKKILQKLEKQPESKTQVQKKQIQFKISEKTIQIPTTNQINKKKNQKIQRKVNYSETKTHHASELSKNKNQKINTNRNIQQKNQNKKQALIKEQININEMIKMNKDSIKQIHNNQLTSKYISTYEKYGKLKLQLPHIPPQQKPIFQSDIYEKKQIIVPKSNQNDILVGKDNKTYDQRVRLSKIKKMQQQAVSNIRSLTNNKNGNFIMPKIFDIVVDQKQSQKLPFPLQTIKLNPILKYSHQHGDT